MDITTQLKPIDSDTAVGSGWGPITPEHALKYYGLLEKAVGCEGIADALSCMQSQSIENIFANEDVMQGGTVWNAVPDYMFTKGCKSYEGLFIQFFTLFTCLKFLFI